MGDIRDRAIFPGNYSSLVKVAEFVRKGTQEAGFDSAVSYHIELALDEAVTNIIEHAYGGEGKGDIELEYYYEPKRLTFQVIDHGQPFRPEDVNKPNINAPLSDRKSHGLGLYLVNCLMDEVHFEFDLTTGNKLILVKYKE
ncbi:MAG: ATP-binding protein [Chloroflexi bacterium]|nr:ATP-binding protein [Chloroflexota bacterium]